MNKKIIVAWIAMLAALPICAQALDRLSKDEPRILTDRAQADQRARDPDVKALVEKLPPVVDRHLDEVRPLAKNKCGSL